MQKGSTAEQKETLALPAAANAIGLSTRSLDRLIQAGAIRDRESLPALVVTVKELNRFLAEGGHAENLPEDRADRDTSGGVE